MQIVIDIDEGIMQGIIEGKGDKPREIVRSFQATIADAIKNGTPLPKGHGRLGDLDALQKEVSSWGMNDYEPSDFTYAIDQADTIIEADKKYEVEYEVEYEAEVITRGNCMMCGKELTEGLFFCKECEDKASSRK